MSQPKPPTPNPAGDYKRSLQVYLKYLPQLLQGEQTARTTYDPQRVQEQLGLQAQYGPEQYAQQRQAISELDPGWLAARAQLGTTAAANLQAANAGQLPPGLQEAWDAQARASGVAHGNTTGAAPAAFEDVFKAQNLLNYQQKAMENVGAFLAGATPEQQASIIQPVTPDRASAYVNPSAPGQLAAPNYQNTLAAWQASGAGRNPWLSSLSGAASGALSVAATPGLNATGGYGIAAGAILGGIGGYFGNSDVRLKNHIEYIGRSAGGHPIYEFNYNDCPGRFRGTIAQELLATCPQACTLGKDGFWRVRYDMIDIKLEQVGQEVLV